MRIFGLIVALVAFVAPAQAALLTYSFNGNANGVVSPASAGTPSAYGLGGSLGTNQWNLAGLSVARNSGFSLTAGTNPLFLSDIYVSAKRNTTQAGKSAKVAVYYNIGATSNTTSGTFLGDSTLGSGFTSFPFTVNTTLLAGQKIHFTIRSFSTDGFTGTTSYDFVTLNGNVVPEPTSMAVFGLLGAGIAARRIRRKA